MDFSGLFCTICAGIAVLRYLGKTNLLISCGGKNPIPDLQIVSSSCSVCCGSCVSKPRRRRTPPFWVAARVPISGCAAKGVGNCYCEAVRCSAATFFLGGSARFHRFLGGFAGFQRFLGGFAGFQRFSRWICRISALPRVDVSSRVAWFQSEFREAALGFRLGFVWLRLGYSLLGRLRPLLL